MEVRSKVLKIRNLPQGNKRIGSINAKPYAFFVVTLIAGILLVMKQSHLIGSIGIILSLYQLCFTQNEKLAEFYVDYAVFYHINDHKDECFLLFWEEVEDWQCICKHSGYDRIEITLNNQKNVSLRCVDQHKINRYLKRFTHIQKEALSRSKLL